MNMFIKLIISVTYCGGFLAAIAIVLLMLIDLSSPLIEYFTSGQFFVDLSYCFGQIVEFYTPKTALEKALWVTIGTSLVSFIVGTCVGAFEEKTGAKQQDNLLEDGDG